MIKKAMVLVVTLIIIVVLTMLGTTMVTRGINNYVIGQRYFESAKAFWLAEAGINRALDELRISGFSSVNGTGLWATNLGEGTYLVDTVTLTPDSKKVTAYGYIPDSTSPRTTRVIETVIRQFTPPGFYDNAIYSAGDITLSGSSYEINGSVIYAGNITGNTSYISEPPVEDDSITPLARLDFKKLRDMSVTQGNFYDEERLDEVDKNNDSFPADFWNNETTGIPNIVYIEGDLVVKGNDQIGGFFIVVGDVLDISSVVSNATLSGNVAVDGLIYTRGTFDINGGGNNLNVNGGVWAGEEAILHGNAKVLYNQTYMNAIDSLDIDTSAQMESWKDTQTPYQIQ